MNLPTNPRDEARATGAEEYFDLKETPCERGHVWSRRVSDGHCLMCPDAEPDAVAPYISAARRKVAEATGERTYTTGKPCHRGHWGPRYTSSGACVECAQATQRTHGTMADRQRLRDERALRYLAMVDDGTSLSDIAKQEGVSRQMVHQLVDVAKNIRENIK